MTGIEVRPEMHWGNVSLLSWQLKEPRVPEIKHHPWVHQVIWRVSNCGGIEWAKQTLQQGQSAKYLMIQPLFWHWRDQKTWTGLLISVWDRSWAAIPDSVHTTHSSKAMSALFFAPCFSRPCQQTTWLRGTFWTFSKCVHFWSAY